MTTYEYFSSFYIAIINAIGVGLLFHFLKGEGKARIGRDIGLASIGTAVGWIASLLLPILPESRFLASISLTNLMSIVFMSGHWMATRYHSPVASFVDDDRFHTEH